MSLTEAQTVFASIHETALNDVIRAFCFHRPRLLAYGSPAFVPVTTAAETRMDAIDFPGVPGGIQWRIRFDVPSIDLFKQSDPLPPELALNPNQFSVRLAAELCIDCRRIRIDPRPPRPKDPREEHGEPHRPDEPQRDHRELTCFRLEVFGIGHLERVLASTGADAVVLVIDAVEIVDIEPDGLEAFLECLLFMILQAVFANFRLPLDALRVGAFSLVPTVGPLIEDDQIKARGIL